MFLFGFQVGYENFRFVKVIPVYVSFEFLELKLWRGICNPVKVTTLEFLLVIT